MNYLNRDPHLVMSTFLIETPRKAEKDIKKWGKKFKISKSLDTIMCFYREKFVYFISEWGIIAVLNPSKSGYRGIEHDNPSQLRLPRSALSLVGHSSWLDFELTFYDDMTFTIENIKYGSERIDPFFTHKTVPRLFRKAKNLKEPFDFEKVKPSSAVFEDPRSRKDVKEMFYKVASMFT